MTRRARRSSLWLLLCAALAAPAWGEPDAGADCKCNPDSEWLSYWKFSVTPYLWLFFIDGDIGAGGKRAEVSANFTDLFKHTDSMLGIELNLQAENGPWTVIVDPTWLRATSSFSLAKGPLRVKGDETADFSLIDAMVLREAARWSWREEGAAPTESDRSLALDLLGGMRATIIAGDLDLKLKPPGNLLDDVKRQFDSTQSWVDPVIGGRATLDLGRFTLLARGDVGGFTISSDITSEMWASALYKFKLLGLDAFTGAAFRAVYDDYDASNGFLYRTWTYGPVVGMGFRF